MMENIKFKPVYVVWIGLGIALFGADLALFLGTRWFFPVIILAVSIAWAPFWFDISRENKRQKEIELQFLEFMRNLAEAIKSGIPIPKAIIHISKKDFQSLNPYTRKLANQIECGIPTRTALTTFSHDTNNKIIKRSISIIIEAEQSGGDITDIITSVVDSVITTKKMKLERRSSTHSQIVQGYMVYYIFIAIMLALQLWLFPKLAGLSSTIQGSASTVGGLLQTTSQSFNMDFSFFSLIMIQGLFAGIMVGKFSEGTIKNGLLHALALMTTGALIITLIKGTI